VGKKENLLCFLVQRENTIWREVQKSVEPGGDLHGEQGKCLRAKGQSPELSRPELLHNQGQNNGRQIPIKVSGFQKTKTTIKMDHTSK